MPPKTIVTEGDRSPHHDALTRLVEGFKKQNPPEYLRVWVGVKAKDGRRERGIVRAELYRSPYKIGMIPIEEWWMMEPVDYIGDPIGGQ